MASTDLQREVNDRGFALVPNAVDSEAMDRLCAALARLPEDEAVRRRAGGAFAVRNVLELLPEARELIESASVRRLVVPVLGPDAHPVKATLFDKTPDANWHVGWHQDVTIAVRERHEVPGFSAWSVKAGVPHVQPPVEVLQRVLAVRVHLDPCRAENGALRVIPGSHMHGRLSSEEVREWVATGAAVTCAFPAGGALLMRPLLLHASHEAVSPSHRRVLHVEFASDPLPGALQWAWC
jgi:ectoine hydroxylase-related dioxygenase (phytanoyl-CoA dioxygenase family)